MVEVEGCCGVKDCRKLTSRSAVDTPTTKGRTARKERAPGRHPHTHLHLNSQKCTSYAVMRNVVISFLEAMAGARPSPWRWEHGRKGKGQGKDGEAKGKGKGTEKQDIAMKFEGYCSNPQL